MAKLFVSYRRSDGDITGRICDRLQDTFGEESIFKDVDSLLAGHDFRGQLYDAVKACDVMLAVIGPNWTKLQDESGKSRLANEEDFVRIEIEAALERNIPVIPLLIHGASMPCAGDLPDTLRELAFNHALAVHRDPDFRTSVRRLVKQLEKVLASQAANAAKSACPPERTGAEKSRPAAEAADRSVPQPEKDGSDLSDCEVGDQCQEVDASVEPGLTAMVVHMHHAVGTLADLILPQDFDETTGRIDVGFTDPSQPSHLLRHVSLDLSSRSRDAVRYLRLSGLRLGNEWWGESHPVVVRVYRPDRIARWISAEKNPSAHLVILEQSPVRLITDESVGYMKSGEFRSVVDAKTRVPCVVTRRFKTTKPNQTQINIRTAAAATKSGPRHLGASLVASVLPAPVGEAWVDCEFRVDQDGRVTLNAHGPFTRQSIVVVFG